MSNGHHHERLSRATAHPSTSPLQDVMMMISTHQPFHPFSMENHTHTHTHQSVYAKTGVTVSKDEKILQFLPKGSSILSPPCSSAHRPTFLKLIDKRTRRRSNQRNAAFPCPCHPAKREKRVDTSMSAFCPFDERSVRRWPEFSKTHSRCCHYYTVALI